ncbi:probable glucuronoxylan glucuronosyltransferase IRX7 [Aristolochia californica]|uniref:probable glucuronoxylan glucuronosyltransferase IRX7 n=1 Tax=Aristolochia californica TaxID=171875 RepID=UPI0035E34745
MVELRRNVGRKKSFSLRMKHRNIEANNWLFSYRYLRWFLWVSLALYLFSSYLLGSSTTSDKLTSLQKTTFATPTTAFLSRAIIEPEQPFDRREDAVDVDVDVPPSMRDLKIYVYDLPAKYNEDWLSNPRCSNHLFAAEVAIHRALLGSDRFRTLDPWEADFFFVPVYVTCNFSTVNGFPAIGHARTLLASAVQLLSTELPFWNRSRGADHVFVATHDFGACFHTLEDVAVADGIPSFLKNSIILQTFGVKSKHPCQDVENVVIPPYVSPDSVRETLERAPAGGERDIWVFFRGKMEVHPKNISGRFYSKGVRTAIWHKFNRHRDFYMKRKRFAGYQSEIVRSVFCLCPLGWAPWSPRLVESVALGCVPVIIADDIQLPFPASVPWSEISLRVAEKDVERLDRILHHVASTNLSTIQRNLWEPAVRRSLFFNADVVAGDATWQVLEALAGKLERSFRRSEKETLGRAAG